MRSIIKPRPILFEMHRIIQKFVVFLEDYNKPGYMTLSIRFKIWFLKLKFRMLVFLLRRCILSERDRFKYIQIRGEYHSASVCMDIICSRKYTNFKEPLLI